MQTKTPVKWEEKTLGDFCEVIAGQSPEGKYYNHTGNGLPFYQGKKEFSEKYIGSPATWTTKVTKEAVEGDILMSVRAPVGPINYATQKCCIGRGLAAIRRKTSINQEFLFYYLLSKQNEISGHEGVVFSSINRTEICSLKILMPTIEEEQQRIVEILDKAFEDIEQLTANAKQNLQNAKDLFESYLEQVFSEDTNGYIQTTFGAEIKVRSGDFLPARSMIQDGIYPVYGGNGINGNHDQYNYSNENVVIGRVGEKCGNVHYTNGNVWVTDNAFVVIETKNQFDKKFLTILLRRANLRNYAKKSTHPVISGTGLSNVKLSFPLDISKQQEIVEKIVNMQEETQQLEQIYQQKIEQAEELKQSILQKAFNGEL